MALRVTVATLAANKRVKKDERGRKSRDGVEISTSAGAGAVEPEANGRGSPGGL